MSNRTDQAYRRRPLLSAHNWHSWSMPPSARNFGQPPHGDEAPVQGPQPMCTAAEAMVRQLCKLGLNTFFGLPGGPVIPVFDAILTHPEARLIEPRHETYGTFAAMGYYRASGQVPVVVVTAGPGATNVVTGVMAAHLERVPMLVICGDVPWSSTGRKMFQDTGETGVGVERIFKGMARSVIRIAQPASASTQVCAALKAATDPAYPGPALVVISIDQAGKRTVEPEIYAPSSDRLPRPPAPETRLLHKVAQHLGHAQRPLILIGAGCRHDAIRMRRLVDAAGIPFVTTPQAKGLVSEDHPLSLRTCGAGSSVWAQRYMNGSPDVTLVLGTDLDDMSMAGTPPVGPDGLLIHVDTDSSVISRNVRTAIAAVYDVGAFADGLTSAIIDLGTTRDGVSLLADIRAQSAFSMPEFATDPSLPLAPHRAIADLEQAAGQRATFITDIGEHTLFALHYLKATEDHRFLVHQGLGSMGSGISSAIGLALGAPDRRVICVCGDGGMQMAGMEILVALKLRLPVIYAIFNDARYNMVYHGYKLIYNREAAWETPIIDFAQWAHSLGARGYRVERPGEITSELLDTLTADSTPAVLDIRHDSDLRISNNGRGESLKGMAHSK